MTRLPEVLHGDCVEVLKTCPPNVIDSIVTDPPYGLEFMGQAWDAPWKSADQAVHADARTRRAAEVTPTGQAHTTSAGPYLAAGVNKYAAGLPFQQWCTIWAQEAFRVLKPGGYLIAFGGTRTWHRLACAIEDAGFEMRDSIAWLYGSGFPKSLDVSKAIDKAAGAERTEVIGTKPGHENWVGRDGYKSVKDGGALSGEGGFARPWMSNPEASERYHMQTAPATPEAAQWQGWGTALKPAFEPIVVARKPFPGTVATNVLRHGTGALNVDACRINYQSDADMDQARVPQPAFGVKGEGEGTYNFRAGVGRNATEFDPSKGRWPANVVLDESQAAMLDRQSGTLTSGKAGKNGHVRNQPEGNEIYGGGKGLWQEAGPAGTLYSDSGGASRFFPVFRYQAKAPTKERPEVDGTKHPTVKPLSLMRWLVRLVTPPGGTVLDLFAGSGTTGEAAYLEGFNSILIEGDAKYLPLIQVRIARVQSQKENVK